MPHDRPVNPPSTEAGDAPISLEAESADLLEVLRSAGTTDAGGNPIIPVTDDVQWAINRTQEALNDPLRKLLVRDASEPQELVTTNTDPRPPTTEKRFPCGDCGQFVTATERHTWEDCRAYEQARGAR